MLVKLVICFLIGFVFSVVCCFVSCYYITRIYPRTLTLAPIESGLPLGLLFLVTLLFLLTNPYYVLALAIGMLVSAFVLRFNDLALKMYLFLGGKQPLYPRCFYEEGGPFYFGDGADSFWE